MERAPVEAKRDIARVLAVDPKTLRRHYREELDTGHIKATAKVAEFLFRKAITEGPQCVTAAIFWMKTRGGWRETPQEHEVRLGRSACEYSDEELMRIMGIDDLRLTREEAAITARRLIEANPHRSD